MTTVAKTVVVDDDGRPVLWRRPLAVRLLVPLLTFLMICMTTALAFNAPSVGAFLLVGFYLVVAWIVGWGTWRAQISLDHDLITIVTYRGTRRIALRDVVDAKSGYYGLTVRLADATTISSSLAATANMTRWRGKVSRSDLKGALVLGRAAEARGEVGFPRTLTDTRSAGNLAGGLWGALAALLSSS